jgi:hypothetical protein
MKKIKIKILCAASPKQVGAGVDKKRVGGARRKRGRTACQVAGSAFFATLYL